MVWKGKFLLLAVWIAVTAAASVAVMRMKPIYRAETLVLVESQKIPDKFVTSTVIQDVQDRLATISQEILSTTRLKRIVEDYQLYSQERTKRSFEEIVDLMRGDVELKLEKGWTNNRPGAFRIGYQGPDPRVVAAVANRLAGLYIDENLRVREVQAEGTSQFINAQLSEAKQTLDELERAVSKYKVLHNGELPQQESAISSGLGRLQTELQGTQDAMNRAQQSRLVFDAELGTIVSRLSALGAERTPDPPALSAKPQSAPAPPPTPAPGMSASLTAQLNALRLRYSDQHPEVKRVQMALEEALKEEQRQAAKAPPPPPAAQAESPVPQRRNVVSPEVTREIELFRQRASTLRAQRENADHEIERLTERRKTILREMDANQARLRTLPIREQEMAAITRDYETAKANYRSLLDKKTSADMATDMERRQKAERFMVLDPAQIPEKPAKPNRPALIGLSCALGLVLGMALAFAKEWKKDLLLGEWELPPDVPVLGRIPVINIQPASVLGAGRWRKKSRSRALASTVPALLLACAAIHLLRGAL